MLARLAENLFWAGRYVERANDTARLLDVTYHGRLEVGADERRRMWADLLHVLHQTLPPGTDEATVTGEQIARWLVMDRTNDGSIVASAERLRENIRSLREQVSTELWEAANLLWLSLSARDLARDLDREAYAVLAEVKRHCQTIVGAADETMARDDGWRFFALGRQLERALMSCRLVNRSLRPIVEQRSEIAFHDWVVLLKSAGGLEAFRRSQHTATDPIEAIAFLVVDPAFPRSVRFAVARSESYLGELRGEGTSLSSRVLGRLVADLDFCDVHLLVREGEIEGFLDHVFASVQLSVDAITAEFFRGAAPAELHVQQP